MTEADARSATLSLTHLTCHSHTAAGAAAEAPAPFGNLNTMMTWNTTTDYDDEDLAGVGGGEVKLDPVGK